MAMSNNPLTLMNALRAARRLPKYGRSSATWLRFMPT
jgi:hypothetical protein